MEYSNDQRFQNYEKLLKTIQFIESNQRITEDWVEENKDRITLYREWVSNYGLVNSEIKNNEFREIAKQTEQILQLLCGQLHESKAFDIRMYLQLSYCLRFLADNTMNKDELEDFMARLTI
jgi:hypothetical protein